jgi:hypothetical protein
VRRIAAAIAVCALAGCPVAALAAPQTSIPHANHLWATIDECQPATSGAIVGVRASMPGTGDASEEMFMRFTLQYRAPAHRHWHKLAGSRAFVNVGSAAYVSRQAGFNFRLSATTAPGTVLRGVVDFQWRRGASIAQSVLRFTSAGRRPSAGAQPSGYSAARCSVS